MNRYCCAILLLFMLSGSHSSSAQAVDSAQVIRSLHRCWRVVSYELSNIYGLEDEEIKTYAKQKLCFSTDSIRMFSNTLIAPRYAMRKVNAEDYAKENFEVSKTKLAIMTDSVVELTISSVTRPNKNGEIFKMTDVIAYDDDFIYVVVDGVIFKLFAADRKTEAKGAR